MFWQSVWNGLKVLGHWEAYVAGLEYLAIFMLPMLLFALIKERSESAGGILGCLSMILIPMLQAAAILVLVITLSPIILGIDHNAAWTLPWAVLSIAPGLFAKSVVTLLVVSFVLAFIPILGQFQSLQTLVLGAISLVFSAGLLKALSPGTLEGGGPLYPGFWFVIGLLVIGGGMSFIGTMVAALFASAVGTAHEDTGQLLVFPVAAIFGFIPVFIYGAWLGAQLRG